MTVVPYGGPLLVIFSKGSVDNDVGLLKLFTLEHTHFLTHSLKRTPEGVFLFEGIMRT
jgi:hypothetical protein